MPMEDDVYEEIALDLTAAGGLRSVLRLAVEADYIGLVDVITDVLEVSVNDGSYRRLRLGAVVRPRRPISKIAVRNSSGGPITGTLCYGRGSYIDNRVIVASAGGGTLPVSIQNPSVVVAGLVADGAAIGGAAAPVLMAGQDGTNVQSIKTDATGRQETVGAVAAGSAIGTSAPVLVGGSDGTNVQRMAVDVSGRAKVVGTVAHDGAVVAADAPELIAAEARSTERAAVQSGDVARIVCDLVGKQIVLPFSNPENQWSYAAAAGGILNSAVAVTMKAAAGAGLRNYITGVELMSEALTTATELAIRDGAGGTVLWRTKVPTGGLPTLAITFPVPLKGTANTLLEVVTLTASGAGAVYVNAQGYVGA